MSKSAQTLEHHNISHSDHFQDDQTELFKLNIKVDRKSNVTRTKTFAKREITHHRNPTILHT